MIYLLFYFITYITILVEKWIGRKENGTFLVENNRTYFNSKKYW